MGEPIGYTVAGERGCGSALDRFDGSFAMFIDQQLNIYISDYYNHRITLWTPANTTSSTLVISFIFYTLCKLTLENYLHLLGGWR